MAKTRAESSVTIATDLGAHASDSEDDTDLEAGDRHTLAPLEPASPHPPPAAAASVDNDPCCCYICMDEDDGENGLGPTLSHICACTTTTIHTICLEKMLNSKKSRAKPLSERRLCTVCHTPHQLDLVPFILSAQVLPSCVERVMRTTTGQHLLRVLLFIVFMMHVAVFAIVLAEQVVPVFAIAGYLVIASIPVLVVRHVVVRRRARVESLDDNAFYERAVAYARYEVAHGHGSSEEQLSVAPRHSLILLVAATVEPGAPKEPRRVCGWGFGCLTHSGSAVGPGASALAAPPTIATSV
jgi:hypothetical protein